MVEMEVENIGVDSRNYHKVVILRERNTKRYLPIWIGSVEADAIAVKLHNVELPRPMTHDLLQSVITSLGASVEFIAVDSLEGGTFFAKVYLKVDGEGVEIDSRPSDAIALAVRVGAPVYAEEAVLDEAGVILEGEAQPGAGGEGAPEGRRESGDLSAFEEFISTLPLEDLGQKSARGQEDVRDKDTGELLHRPGGYTGKLYGRVTDRHKQYLRALADIAQSDFVTSGEWREACRRRGIEVASPEEFGEELVYGVFASRGWIEVSKEEAGGASTYRLTEKGTRYVAGLGG
jgi:hypothetical protein